MKNTVIAILCFLVGAATVFGYRYMLAKRTAPLPAASKLPSPTPEPTFALVPPSQSVSGILTISKGKAQKWGRNDDGYKEASTGAQILTGESVVTEDLSAATATVSGIVTIIFGQDAELSFANLYPTNMTLQQKSGKITYEVIDTQYPVSVRALHTLVSMNTGKTTINVVDTDMSIIVTAGSAKFAFVDSDNITHVWELTAGQRANIDDAARKVYFVSPR